MRRALVVLVCPLLLALSVAPRVSAAPPGVNLAWSQCVGDGGTHNRTFACDTNAGTEQLVLSIVPDSLFEGVTGVEIHMMLVSESAPFPDWWQLSNIPGSCRRFSLTMASDAPPGAVACQDWARGLATAAIASYSFNTAKSVELLCVDAVPTQNAVALQPGQEYSTGRLIISHAKTVGTGACSGCDVRMCILFTYAWVSGAPSPQNASGQHLRSADASPQTNQSVTWQGGALTNYVRGCAPLIPGSSLPAICHFTFDCSANGSTLARPATWGAVKALYR